MMQHYDSPESLLKSKIDLEQDNTSHYIKLEHDNRRTLPIDLNMNGGSKQRM